MRLFLVAGEHSGDALGAKLMTALKERLRNDVTFAGVGGDEMAAQGLRSLFPIEDVAVMGPLNILPKLPKIISRVYQTVDAAIAFRPDAAVIIDSPEFTHPIAKRIRKRAPGIPVIDYVSPSVWAWRPGRAKKMRGYIDEVLALLPFEPDAHKRLGGPPCTYVGHPLIEKLDEIQNADAAGLAKRLGIDDGKPMLLVLPGSRMSEVSRLVGGFGETVDRLAQQTAGLHVIIPAVTHVRDAIVAASSRWRVKPHIVDSSEKYAAMRLARAALAASGTVTLELALAGTPFIGAYKADRLTGPLIRRLVTTETVLLPNLVLGERAFPEFIQEHCTPDNLARAVLPLIGESDVRARQVAALARIPAKMRLTAGTPSEAAAAVVAGICARRRVHAT